MSRSTVIGILTIAVMALGGTLGSLAAPTVPGFRVPGPPSGYEVDAVADMVCREARGESFQGQMAVAYVVANRQRSTLFPPTVAAVLQQPGQFVALSEEKHDGECRRGSPAWMRAKQAASIALTDSDQNHGATFFDRCDSAPSWMRRKDLMARHGAHCFWGERDAVRPE
jgi:N-acetylmuramoyl-L-alanine amidase